jgi:uncharacterized protein HemY
MVEASVQGFLRTILILILVYYALKWLGRILFPVLFQKAVKNFEEKVKQQQGQGASTETVKEGETVIDRRPGPQRESNKDVGEYVDYEEID